jgi:transcriptional regulator with XRE-family HTH domain
VLLRKQFGEHIRQIRAELDKTQEEFAELTGMSVDFLSLIERGRNAPSFKKLERMARGLGKPVSFLFTFDATVDDPIRDKRSNRGRR